MTREVVTVSGLQLTISSDNRPPRTSCLCVIADGQIVDEQSQCGIENAVTATVTLARAGVNVLDDGFFAVGGVPRNVLPGLATTSYPFSLTFSADGYIPQTVPVTIGPIPGFPAVYSSVPLSTISLHRQPATVFGRVVRRVGNATTPFVGAAVSIIALWRIQPKFGAAPIAEAPNIAYVQPPAGAARKAGVDTLNQATVAPIAGTTKVILQQAIPGSTSLWLQDAFGLAVGDLMVLDGGDPATAEVVTLAAVPLTALPDQPAAVTLAAPLIHSHNDGGSAQQVTATAPGPANTFAQDALPGDVVVFLNGLAGLSATDTAEIPGAPSEFHTISLYNVTTDSDGYYRLPPISRVYQIAIQADDGLGLTITQNVWPDYWLPDDNQFDFVFS